MTAPAADAIAAALAALADRDAAALLADVRRDGAQLARRRLTDAYADALVRAVVTLGNAATDDSVSRHPAASAPGATGCYVYAVVAGDGTGAAGGAPGIEPGGPVGTVTVGDITAVVSDVDVEAMRAGATEVAEDSWLAAAVRAHERVVLSAFHSAPTVPMRFGIVHPRREDVADLLAEHADDLRAELRRVEGKAEWSVKVHADPAVVAARAAEAAEADAAPTGDAGRAYLLRERSRRSLAERTREFVGSRVDAIAADLAAAARDSALIGIAHDAGERPVLHAAYLLPRSHEPAFARTVDAITERVAGDGFSVELTGPWAPYHFTALRLEASHG
jgi:hypothetical protein